VIADRGEEERRRRGVAAAAQRACRSVVGQPGCVHDVGSLKGRPTVSSEQERRRRGEEEMRRRGEEEKSW
jgi:hypothetical protein